MARVIENGRSFKGLVFFEQGVKGYGGLTIIVVVARAFFALDIVKFNTILPIIYLFRSFTGSLTVASFNDATVKEPVKNVNR